VAKSVKLTFGQTAKIKCRSIGRSYLYQLRPKPSICLMSLTTKSVPCAPRGNYCHCNTSHYQPGYMKNT